jgi:hypothetical protein
MTVAALAGGSWVFLGFIVVMFFAVAYGYYTVRGSGINVRPYAKVYGGAPGAKSPANVAGKDELASVRDWQRGTR